MFYPDTKLQGSYKIDDSASSSLDLTRICSCHYSQRENIKRILQTDNYPFPMKRTPVDFTILNRPGMFFGLENMFFSPEKRIYGVLFVVDFQVFFHLTHYSYYGILFIKGQRKRNPVISYPAA